jgi:hypothetical protein
MTALYGYPPQARTSIRWALYAIVPFSGFYTVKLGLSPVYLTFVFAVLALLVGSMRPIRLWQDPTAVLCAALFLMYIVALFVAGWEFDSPLPSAWFNLAFSLLYFIVTTVVLENSSRDRVVKASHMAIVFSIALLSVEFAYRFSHPAEPDELWGVEREDIFWYVYKTSSFMYPDSNSVGLFVACLIGFIVGLPRHDHRRFKIYLIPLIVLLLGSLSRAAIFAISAVLLLQYARGSRARLMLFVGLTALGVVGLLTWFSTDESFLSKFWIAGLVALYLARIDLLELLIGVGPGNAENALGVGAHLLPFTLLVEVGVVGSILSIVIWFSIWKKSRWCGTPLLLAYLLSGLSFTTFAIPWFYSMAAVLIHLARVVPSARFCTHPGLQR